jgi:hypothetical protein
MDHRIRHALTLGTINKFSGQIEADETFVGRNLGSSHRSGTAVRPCLLTEKERKRQRRGKRNPD